MDLQIASWNIRSMNQLKKQKEVLNLLREERIQVCTVLETHIKAHKFKRYVVKPLEDGVRCLIICPTLVAVES